jgi:predicted ATPase
MSDIFAVSPDGLRNSINEEEEFGGPRVAFFDLLLAIDVFYENKKLYKLFKEAMCNILNLDDVHFEASYTKKGRKRVRALSIKTRGSDYADAAEYSDGTLAVAATLAALFSKKRDGPMLFVEELENCLHPAALERLVRFLQDHAHKWPVLITTHSPYLLNCVNPEDVNVAVVDETGAAHFEKVHNTKQLRDYLKSGFMSFGDMLASDFVDVLGK